MEKNILELTLLLMYLTSQEEEPNPFEDRFKQCWKGYSFDTINELTDKGYLFPSKYKNKSVTLTKEGEKFAKDLIEKYLKQVLRCLITIKKQKKIEKEMKNILKNLKSG